MQGQPSDSYVPWLVMIEMTQGELSSHATGFLINESWVMTARHVYEEFLRVTGGNWAQMTAVVLTPPGQPHQILARFDHAILGEGDIVALHLTTPHRLPAGTQFPVVDWNPPPTIGETITTLGFGPGLAQQYVNGIIHGSRRSRRYSPATAWVSGSTNGIVQPGDSGAPILRNNRIVGVNSGDWPGTNLQEWFPLAAEPELRVQLSETPANLALAIAGLMVVTWMLLSDPPTRRIE